MYKSSGNIWDWILVGIAAGLLFLLVVLAASVFGVVAVGTARALTGW